MTPDVCPHGCLRRVCEMCARDAEIASATSYAKTIAVRLHAKHFPEVTQWEPLPDLFGLLTQISNMTAGLRRV